MNKKNDKLHCICQMKENKLTGLFSGVIVDLGIVSISSIVSPPPLLRVDGGELFVVEMRAGNGVDVPEGRSFSCRRFGGSAGGVPCSVDSSNGRLSGPPSQNISRCSIRETICFPDGTTAPSVLSDGTGIGPKVCIYASTVSNTVK